MVEKTFAKCMVSVADLEGGQPPPPFRHQILVELKISDPEYLNILLFLSPPPSFSKFQNPSLGMIEYTKNIVCIIHFLFCNAQHDLNKGG
jgi:hypothetical protein